AASCRREGHERRGTLEERGGAARPARADARPPRADERSRRGDRGSPGAGRDREGSRVAAPAGEAGGGTVSTPEELLELIEPYLDDLALTPELGELERSMRYSLAGGGKRIRPMLCLATAEAAGAEPEAALGMIGGQYLDITGGETDLASLHRLKTGRLFAASVACALWVAEVPEREQAPWRAFADEVGLLFQIVDDILDEDGYLLERGADGARALADETAERAQARLAEVPADTSVLAGIVSGLA